MRRNMMVLSSRPTPKARPMQHEASSLATPGRHGAGNDPFPVARTAFGSAQPRPHPRLCLSLCESAKICDGQA